MTVGRRPGAMRGQIWIAEDFDEWPEDLLDAMEGKEDEAGDLPGVPRVEAARDGEKAMSDEPATEPRIPRPPTKEELDEISEAQAMITDEWAPSPPPEKGPDDQVAPENQSSPGR